MKLPTQKHRIQVFTNQDGITHTVLLDDKDISDITSKVTFDLEAGQAIPNIQLTLHSGISTEGDALIDVLLEEHR